MKKYLLFLFAIFAAVTVSLAADTVVLRNAKTGKVIPYGGTQQGGEIRIPRELIPKAPIFRGAWVATVENIDFPKCTTPAEFQKEYIEVANSLQKLNFNAIIFQIRANNDAFYPSALNPWSRWLTGTEGKAITGFDPLSFMITEAHKRNLEFHAWLNPYRIIASTSMRKNEYLATLHPLNFARKRPDLVLEIPLEGNKYQLIFNPGEPEVVNFVVNSVKEILQRYNVDAIHFDDYFYPYTEIGNIDNATFKKYNSGIVLIDNWRRNNVDTLIYSLRTAIDAHNKKFGKRVQLGISPFGIWANKKNHPMGSLTAGSQSYSRQYADTRSWVKRRWIDYIAPQLYWPFERDVAPYAALAEWWAAQVRGTGVNLYIGLAAYQMGGKSELWQNPDELAAQMRFNSLHSEIKGEIFFSYRNIVRPSNQIMRTGVLNVLEKQWKSKIPPPAPMRRR